MSGVTEVLAIALGGGAMLAQLAQVLSVWLGSRDRRRSVTLRVTAEDGSTREIRLDNLNDPAQAESFLRSVLAREERQHREAAE